jgi:hypothetical protein
VQKAWKESQESEQDISYVGNTLSLQAYPTGDEFVPRLEAPEMVSKTQGDQQAGGESQREGGRGAGA